jgi:hypothetical protein
LDSLLKSLLEPLLKFLSEFLLEPKMKFLLESLLDFLSEPILEFLLEFLSEYLVEYLFDLVSESLLEPLPPSGAGRSILDSRLKIEPLRGNLKHQIPNLKRESAQSADLPQVSRGALSWGQEADCCVRATGEVRSSKPE